MVWGRAGYGVKNTSRVANFLRGLGAQISTTLPIFLLTLRPCQDSKDGIGYSRGGSNNEIYTNNELYIDIIVVYLQTSANWLY